MLESKESQLSLYVAGGVPVGDVAVAVSFEAACDSCCLNKLRCGSTCECFCKGSEEACICFALYMEVRNALCGSPLAVQKSKADCVCFGVNDNMFTIAWKTKSKASNAKISLNMALKKLRPGAVYSTYAELIRRCGGKPDRECFNYVADKILKSMQKSIEVGIVGSVKTHKKDGNKVVPAIDMKDLAKKLHSKLVLEKVDGSKSEPKGHKECEHKEYTELKASGWEAGITKDYLESKMKGHTVKMCNKYLLIDMKEPKWNTFSDKLKGKINLDVEQKYSKAKELAPLLGYMLLADASVSCGDVRQMINKNVKGSDIVKAIKQVLS